MVFTTRALQRRTDKRMTRLIISGLMTMLLLMPAAAQDRPDRAGYFEVRSASTTLVEGVHLLESRLQLVLSADALDALSSGVALRIELNLEVIRSRRFWTDPAEVVLLIGYELEYRPLSQRYMVSHLNSGNQESFATLYSALNNLGRIQGLPVVDDAILQTDKTYRIRLRARLSTEQYPAPLRILFFWRDEWQLESDWFEWLLER